MSSRTISILLIILYQLAFNASVGIAWILPANQEVIPSGITVNGKKVGDMKRDFAISYLNTLHIGSVLDKDITLKDDNRQWVLNTKECGFRYDYGKTIAAVFDKTQWHGTDRIVNSLKLQAQNLDMPFELAWDEEKLNGFLQAIDEQIRKSPQDSALEYVDGSVHLTAEETGESLDIEILTDKIVYSVQHNQTAPIFIDKKPISAHIGITDLEKIDCDLASFSTEIPHNEDPNRYDNILLAAQILDGTVIMPDQVFSFNDRIGERTRETGFKNAPIIISNMVHNDLGGGICQVASTLYNASLLAGLEIVERSPHTVPVKYLPVGRDATVFFGQIDLKIKNTLRNPVAIGCEVDSQKVNIRILGNHRDALGTDAVAPAVQQHPSPVHP